MAASTRVEKLQYKEILTPKWRDVTLGDVIKEEDCKPSLEDCEDVKPCVVKHEVDGELPQKEEKPEPATDEVMKEVNHREETGVNQCVEREANQPEEIDVNHHEEKLDHGKEKLDHRDEKMDHCEEKMDCPDGKLDHREEKMVNHHEGSSPNGLVKIKQEPVEDGVEETEEDLSDEAVIARHLKSEVLEKKRFMNFVTVTNKRNSRRTESGATTPDPMSPDTSLNDSLFRSMSVSSPTPPSTPAFGKDSSLRKRSGSMSRRASEQERLSINEDSMSSVYTGISFSVPSVNPWPVRTFPLLNDDYEDLFREKPTEPEPLVLPKTVCTSADVDRNSVEPSVPSSPLSSSSDVGDDPNDPEWTCVTQEKTGSMPKIVLKLKR